MPENRSKRLLVACCGMDLCWLLALANFMALTTTPIRFPLWAGIAMFLCALGIRGVFMGRGFRRIWPVLAHAGGIGLIITPALYFIVDTMGSTSIYHWYQVCLLCLLLGLFWYKGFRLANRAMTYKSICNHFDLGISMLFALVLIKFLIQLKGGVVYRESFTVNSIGLYFFIGLVAIFFAYNEMGGKKTFVKGFFPYGILISAAVVLLIVCIGSVLLFHTFMEGVAGSLYATVKTAANSTTPFVISFLLFLLQGKGSLAGRPAEQQENQSPAQVFTNNSTGVENSVLIYGLLSLFSMVVFCLICYLIFRVIKFLMLKPSPGSINRDTPGIVSWIVTWVYFLFDFFTNLILSITRNIENANQGFVRLIKWGKRSGMPRILGETPAEYTRRLENRFEPLETQIRTIGSAFELETYGEVKLDHSRVCQVADAIKKIHLPHFWLLRIKSMWKGKT